MKTTAQHKADGTYRDDRHAKRMHFEPLETVPPPPDDLPKGAATIWSLEALNLVNLRTLHDKDLPALRDLVLNVYFMELAQRDLEKNGMTLFAELKDGKKPVSNPAWRQFQDAQKIVIQLRKEFGITPMSGQKIEKPEPPREKKFGDDLFDKK